MNTASLIRRSRLAHLCVGSLALLLVSCGTTVPVSVDVPPAVELSRGVRLNISTNKNRSIQMPVGYIADAHRAAINAAEQVEAMGCFRVTDVNSCDFSLEYCVQEISGERVFSTILYPSEVYGGVYGRSNVATAARNFSDSSAYSEYLRPFRNRNAEIFANDGLRLILPYSIKIKDFSVSAGSDNPELKQAVELCRKGDWATGEKHIAAALAAHPQDPEAHFMRGLLAIQQRDFDSADRFFSEADKIDHSSKYTKAKKMLANIRDFHNRAIRYKESLGIPRLIKAYGSEEF